MTNRSPLVKSIAAFILFVILEAVALVLISNESIIQQLRIMGFYMNVQEKTIKTKTDIKYYFSLDEVNEQLMSENTRLLQELTKYKAAEEAVDSSYTDTTTVNLPQPDSNVVSKMNLAVKQQSVPYKAKFTYIPAKVVGSSSNRKHNYLIINKGKVDGLDKDMGVISPQGVVGVISAVSDNYAYVISYLNVNQSVSAKLSGSNAFGPMIWDGKRINYAVLTEIPQHIKFHYGDTVRTSGFSTLFPPDLPLGTVKKSKIIKGTHHEIQVKLFQDFKTLLYVRVVKNNDRQEIDQLSKGNEI